MKHLANLVWSLRIWRDTKGQDMIEYALLAGFVATAASAIVPGMGGGISTIFSQVGSVLNDAIMPAGSGSTGS